MSTYKYGVHISLLITTAKQLKSLLKKWTPKTTVARLSVKREKLTLADTQYKL